MSAADRVVRIDRLFTSICDTLDEMMAQFGTSKGCPPKDFNFKLSELQSAHVSLNKAQEVFYEKFAGATLEDNTNFDDIRDDIGRKLDRIRAALDAG
tara:strand:- start:11066 stop:11356 length:291 start_codon:yes stop_codon:yes gene_type:complete